MRFILCLYPIAYVLYLYALYSVVCGWWNKLPSGQPNLNLHSDRRFKQQHSLVGTSSRREQRQDLVLQDTGSDYWE